MTSLAVRQFDEDLEMLLRVLHELPGTETRMRESLPDMAAAAYDVERGGTTVWCDEHERPVTSCHKLEDPSSGRPWACVGVPLARVSDPTGEGAAGTQVLADARTVSAAIAAVRHARKQLVRIVRLYADVDSLPADVDAMARANTAWCERHLRFGHERESRTANGSRLKLPAGGFVFAEPHRLCQWCEDLAYDEHKRSGHGRLATEHEIDDHVAGKRRRVRA